jgi:hypothetical protein
MSPVRTLYRVSALLGLITYKTQGKAQRLRARAVDLENAAHVELLFSGVGGADASAPLPAAPLVTHAALRAQLVALRDMLARPRSVALPALAPTPLLRPPAAEAGSGEGGGGEPPPPPGGAGASPAAAAVAEGGGAHGELEPAAAAELERKKIEEQTREEEEEEEVGEEEEEGEEHTEAWPAEEEGGAAAPSP